MEILSRKNEFVDSILIHHLAMKAEIFNLPSFLFIIINL